MTRRLRKPIRRTISVLTAVLAGISVFQIVPIEAEENSFEATVEEDNEKLEVKASAPSGTLPEDAKLVVTPIKNDGNDSLYADTWNRLNAEAQKENKAIDAFIAYDIQFEKDDKATEPVNGNVNVDLKWDTPVKPDGVQDGDQISVIHLKNDETAEDLTKETDTTKNHATSETDENDPLSLKGVTIQSDSFSVYTVVWTRDLTPAPETTDSAAPAATEETSADNTEVQLPTAENDEYSVNVSYNRNEVTNIPADAYVTVESYADDSAEYNTAREAVIAQKQEDDSDFDASSLGMKAFDISIHSPASTDEIEPDGKVSVSIKLKKLPDEVQEGDSLNIQHIVSQDPAEPAQTETDPSQVKAETVAADVKAEDGAVASFETESFSTYTVQWESDQDGASDDYYRSLNGRTVMIVFQNGEKYYALSSDLVNSGKNNDKGYLKMVEIKKPTINGQTTTIDDNNANNIYWRFTKNGQNNYFIESVEKGGIAREKGHKNDFTYLRTRKDKPEYSGNILKGYEIWAKSAKEINEDNKDNAERESYQIVKDNNSAHIKIQKEYSVHDKNETKDTNAHNLTFDLTVDDNNAENGVHLWNNPQKQGCNLFTLYDVDTSITDQTNKNYNIEKIKTVDSIAKGINIKMFNYKGQYDNTTDQHYQNDGQGRGDSIPQTKYIKQTNNFTQGIVENQLTNGYPTVTTTYKSTDDNHANENSLQYLFKSSGDNGEVKEYDNVNKLFSEDAFNKTGYYEYNCFQNYAYLNQSKKNDYKGYDFDVYNQIGTPLTAGYYGKNPRNDTSAFQRGNFMPFNDLYEHNEDGTIKEGTQKFSTFTNEFDGNDDPLRDSERQSDREQAGRKIYKTQGITDYFFGMQMDMDFIQPEGGVVPEKNNGKLTGKNTNMIYDFNGDDDLWIFIDNVLTLDIGGIHGACHGSIDFATGEVIYRSWEGGNNDQNFYKDYKKKVLKDGFYYQESDKTYRTTIYQCFKNANKFPDGSDWDDGKVDQYFVKKNINGKEQYATLKDLTKHHLSMFYMERGAGASDLQMRFNITSIRSDEFTVSKNVSNADAVQYKNQSYKFTAYFRPADQATGDGTKLTLKQYDDWKKNNNYASLRNPYYVDITTGAETDITFNDDETFNLTPNQIAHFPLPQTSDYYCVQENIDNNKYECSGIVDDKGTDIRDTNTNKSQWKKPEENKVVGFTNTIFEQQLKLVKEDSSSQHKLSGAVFTLKNGTNNTSPQLTNDQLQSYVKISDTNGVFSTNGKKDDSDDGVITLPAGTYTLKETQAPNGYNLSNDTWTITVKKAGSDGKNGVTITSNKNEDCAITGPEGDNNLYTITIKNTPGTTLPNTGGKGIWIYIFSGSILILFSAYMLYRKHKNKDAYMHLES